MIPLRDANPTHRTPYVTLAIIALNVIAFLFWQEMPIGGVDPRNEDQIRTLFCYGVIPNEVSNLRPIPELDQACGGKSVLLSVFTSMFLHGSILHIAGNMLYLWIFGNNVEDRMGRLVFVLFYLAAGVVAVFAQVFPAPGSEIPLVGASGAIAGTLGAYIVMFPHARVVTLVPIYFFLHVMQLPAVIVLGFWFVLQAIQGVGSLGGVGEQGGVAWWAHIGGFVFGAVVALIFFRRPRRPRLEFPDLPPGWGT